jgi:hypothetical protein
LHLQARSVLDWPGLLPLYLSTMLQLGLLRNRGIPGLVVSGARVASSASTAAVYTFLSRWSRVLLVVHQLVPAATTAAAELYARLLLTVCSVADACLV